MQNQTNLNNLERVEVMALFGYQMTPCQPLTFKRHGYDESEVTELLRTHIRFVGKYRDSRLRCLSRKGAMSSDV